MESQEAELPESVPKGQRVTLFYDGQFSSNKKNFATNFDDPIKVINPMSDSGVSISSVRVLELEEKPKSERKFSINLSLKLVFSASIKKLSMPIRTFNLSPDTEIT